MQLLTQTATKSPCYNTEVLGKTGCSVMPPKQNYNNHVGEQPFKNTVKRCIAAGIAIGGIRMRKLL